MSVGASDADEDHSSVDALVHVRGWRPPNVMKLDVEGHELAVLHGATAVLCTYRPKLMIEVHSARLEEDCRNLLVSVGYRVAVVANSLVMAEHMFRRGHNRWLCAE
jgi:hypothetical protein